MDERDPRLWVNEPLRRAIDGVVYRWLALFCAPVAAAVIHRLSNDGSVDYLVHIGLPAFLCAYIAVHLLGRPWRRRGERGGWSQASEVDRGTVTLARCIGWVAVIGCGMALIAPLGSLGDPRAFAMEVLLWFPILFPLYALAVWVTLDCADHRLGRAVDESRRRFQAYWSQLAGRPRSPSA